jgi:homoserine kinase
VRSQIPVSRGLGSSAALAAAAAAACGADDPFAVAAAWDGHPENAAASVFGGLVAAADVEGTPSAAHLPLSRGLAFVVIVPDRPLVTAEARAVLPETLSRDDALFNLGRMGLLLAGLADPALLTPEATADRLHQNARATLFPEAPIAARGLGGVRCAGVVLVGRGPVTVGYRFRSVGGEGRCRSTGRPGRFGAVRAGAAPPGRPLGTRQW